MGQTYKAVEITKPGTFRLVEKPVVEPGAHDVDGMLALCADGALGTISRD